MQKIIVSVTNDLTTDQRVHKVCSSLVTMNFEVLLVGRKLTDSIPLQRIYNTHRIKLLFNKGALFYAEYNIRLFFYLLFKRKDILLSNDLDTLLANYLISKTQNKKLVYDSHELFTEVPELVNRPKTQKIWLMLEQNILPKLKNTYTVCQSIADYYNEKYATNFKVIKNVPVCLKNNDKILLTEALHGKPKTIIYQGALNIGRGLELMIETVQYLENIQLIIIGDGDITEKLKSLVTQKKLVEKVFFLGKKTPEELRKITPLADLGISIEEDLGLNYRYALPNKIFDYIHASIPILVSDLPEMKHIVLEYQVGEIINNRKPKELAKQIESILRTKKHSWKRNLKIAASNLQWQKEEEVLHSIFTYLQ